MAAQGSNSTECRRTLFGAEEGSHTEMRFPTTICSGCDVIRQNCSPEGLPDLTPNATSSLLVYAPTSFMVLVDQLF